MSEPEQALEGCLGVVPANVWVTGFWRWRCWPPARRWKPMQFEAMSWRRLLVVGPADRVPDRLGMNLVMDR